MGKLVKDMTPEERERRKARQAAYRAANLEKVRASDAAYRAANLEKVRARRAAWAAAHPEVGRAWVLANPEKRKAAVAAWSAANPEKRSAAAAARNAAHPEKLVLQHLRVDHGITDPPQELVELIVANRRLKRLLKEKKAEAISNAAGKMISSAKVQIEYYQMRKEKPKIAFLSTRGNSDEAV